MAPIKPPRMPRLTGWTVLALLLGLGVWFLSPQNLGLTLYKLSLVTLAGVVAYWFDRHLFHYSRPDRVPESRRGMAEIRRAIIVAAFVVAIALAI